MPCFWPVKWIIGHMPMWWSGTVALHSGANGHFRRMSITWHCTPHLTPLGLENLCSSTCISWCHMDLPNHAQNTSRNQLPENKLFYDMDVRLLPVLSVLLSDVDFLVEKVYDSETLLFILFVKPFFLFQFRFANSSMRMNDPLQTLYQLMSGRQPAAVTVCAFHASNGPLKWPFFLNQN